MKPERLFAAVIFLAAALILSGSTALPPAPRPAVHLAKHDGFTLISFDVPENTKITYTVDSTKPSDKSPEYKSGNIRFDKNGKLRIRVSKKGTKTALYSYSIKVSQKTIIKPKALRNGGTIGIIAPAKYIDGDFSAALDIIRKKGYKIKTGETCYLKNGVFAGTPAQRAADVNRFFADDEVDAILCLRGGSGCMDILGMVDYGTIAAHPKLFIGFSDITALHSAIYRKCGLITVHGAMVSNFIDNYTDYTLDQFFRGISSASPLGEVKLPEGSSLEGLVSGTAEGRIVGGNLSRICQLADTPYAVNTMDSILLIEDTHESAESIRKMLDQLLKNGTADNAEGIIFGEFTDSADSNGMNWKDVISDFAQKAGKPCAMGLPAGHAADNMFLPLGAKAKLTVNKNGSAEFEILESICS